MMCFKAFLKNWTCCPHVTVYFRVTLVVVFICSVYQCCLQCSNTVTNQTVWRKLQICVMCIGRFSTKLKDYNENNTRFSIPGKFLTNWDLGMICSIEKPFSCNPRLCRGFVDSNFKKN